jgi:hypothetical protein
MRFRALIRNASQPGKGSERSGLALTRHRNLDVAGRMLAPGLLVYRGDPLATSLFPLERLAMPDLFESLDETQSVYSPGVPNLYAAEAGHQNPGASILDVEEAFKGLAVEVGDRVEGAQLVEDLGKSWEPGGLGGMGEFRFYSRIGLDPAQCSYYISC